MSLQQHIVTKNHLAATTTATTNDTSQYPNASNVRLLNGHMPHSLTGTPSPGMITSNSSTQGSMSSSKDNGNGGTIAGLHYQIGKKIGEGSFGVLFEGTNIINGMPVAVKFEPRKTEAPQLKDEYRTYKILAGTPGVPQAYYFGQEGLHNILVMDLLGPSLEDLFDWCGRQFSPKTVVQVAVQMITLIEDLHAHDLIYRDIKPDNFLVGRPGQPDENNIHLIDFGEKKRTTDVYDLANGYPVQFARYLEIVRNLGFDETPDYEGYRKLLASALDDIGETMDGKYDWMELNGGRGWDLTINKKPNLHGYGHPNPPGDKSHRNRNAAKGGNHANDANHGGLDPTSYEAYQQQTQQKMLQQQQKQSQRNQNTAVDQQNYRLNNNPINNTSQPNNYKGNGGKDTNMMNGNGNGNRYNFQEQPTTTHGQTKNTQQDMHSSSSEKGFFSKLGCC
ncbi:related to Casein kinase I homolog 2 [Nakaseomyces glabratus]|nr:related to Casein kinase I homolog 2 [Nakaseomyces glabratus]SLM14763.1 related to Casein kinase I homolog 2 [Nakaseomyces glabratus]